ncbi:Eco47II family restriction endonuclease [Brevibacterium luteolum]|uniref:Eco47II family restriction endonuclease n=1 Tax=Brevibacterium luteolum TaxID=199591 RepID=UPI003B674996
MVQNKLEMKAPHLQWVDVDDIIASARHRFGKARDAIRQDAVVDSVEPTLAIVRSILTGLSLEDSGDVNKAVSITKTLQNAVGLFHQDVLSSAHGWKSLGTGGGVLDIESVEPVDIVGGKKVLAEVKMRYNTIKASDQGATWDQLDRAARLHGVSEYVAYLFQIVPNARKAREEPWKVSGREARDHVRVADGVTAYHIVSGDPRALFDLLKLMPYVLQKAFGSFEESDYTPGDEAMIAHLYASSLPTHSALIR